MQGSHYWKEQVEGLEDYDRVFKLKNPQNPVISEGKLTSLKEGRNLSGTDIFQKIIYDIKKRANNNL